MHSGRGDYHSKPPVISGKLVGTKGGNQVIVFPPSSLGTSIWHIPAATLDAIRSEE